MNTRRALALSLVALLVAIGIYFSTATLATRGSRPVAAPDYGLSSPETRGERGVPAPSGHPPTTEVPEVVRLEPIASGVVLSSSGETVAGASVTAASAKGRDAIVSVTTDSDGWFEIVLHGDMNSELVGQSGNPAGSRAARFDLREGLEIRAAASPNLTSRAVQLVPLHGEEHRSLVLVLQEGGTLRGRAVDHNGVSVPLASVIALAFPMSVNPWEGTSADGETRQSHAGTDGRFEILVPPGEFRLFVRSPGDGSVFGRSSRGSVVAGSQIDVGDVVIGGPPVVFKLHVQDSVGRPISGALVRTEPDDSVQRLATGSGDSWTHYTSGEDGVVEFRVEQSDRPLLIGVGHRLFHPVEVVAARATASERDLILTLLPKYRLRLRMHLPGGLPAPTNLDYEFSVAFIGGREETFRYRRVVFDGALVPQRFDYDEPVVRVVDWRTDASEFERSGSDGEYFAHVTRPGDYRVTVRTGPVPPWETRATVSDSVPEAISRHELPPGRIVRVRATPQTPTVPTHGWEVWATVPGEFSESWPWTREEWAQSHSRGMRLVQGDRGTGGSPWTWWIPWRYSMLAARDVEHPLAHRKGGAGDPHSSGEDTAPAEWRPRLYSVVIPAGDSTVLHIPIAAGEVVPSGTSFRVRLVTAGKPVHLRSWYVTAKRDDGLFRAEGATDDSGEVLLDVPPGRYAIDVSGNLAPRRRVFATISSDSDEVTTVDLDLVGRAW